MNAGTQRRALVLDFGGVISRTLFETHAQTESVLGLEPGMLTWRGPFDPSSDDLWRAMQIGEITEREYWLKRAAEVGALLGERWTSMADLVRRVRGNECASAIRPEALAAIEHCKSAGIKLAILSNELDLFYGPEFRARLPFLSAFDVIVDATYTGVLKPDPRAYASCCEQLGIPATAAVFVDDQLRNVVGARAVGMQAVHLDVRDPGAGFHQALTLLNRSNLEISHA